MKKIIILFILKNQIHWYMNKLVRIEVFLLVVYPQACDWSKLLLRWVEINIPNLLLCNEQHASCHDFCNVSFMQVKIEAKITFLVSWIMYMMKIGKKMIIWMIHKGWRRWTWRRWGAKQRWLEHWWLWVGPCWWPYTKDLKWK